MLVKNHLLYDDSGNQPRFEASPNFSSRLKPIYLVIHYTAEPTMDGAVNWFKQKAAKASVPLAIVLDGALSQMGPFLKKAWHSGFNHWGVLRSLNQSLGEYRFASAANL